MLSVVKFRPKHRRSTCGDHLEIFFCSNVHYIIAKIAEAVALRHLVLFAEEISPLTNFAQLFNVFQKFYCFCKASADSADHFESNNSFFHRGNFHFNIVHNISLPICEYDDDDDIVMNGEERDEEEQAAVIEIFSPEREDACVIYYYS
ncbi:Large ribosomal subunit protein [Trichinella pseudospiralis]